MYGVALRHLKLRGPLHRATVIHPLMVACMHAGWNLMNEPRSAKASGIQDIQSWITEVAPFVKTLANHQLVTVGEDGFYGPTTCQAWNGCASLSV